MKNISIILVFSVISFVSKAQSGDRDKTPKLVNSESNSNVNNNTSSTRSENNVPVLSNSGSSNNNNSQSNSPKLLNTSIQAEKIDSLKKIDSKNSGQKASPANSNVLEKKAEPMNADNNNKPK